MSKVISIQLEWSYLPEKYLEDPILIYFEGGELRIKDGTAVATIDPELFNTEKSIREKLTKKIENRLYAVQIMTHQDFQLNKPYRTDVQEDGKKNHFLDVESTAIVTSFGTVDIIVHDKYGNLLSDTKKERLDKQFILTSLLEKHRESDATLDQILISYQKSVKDPENEFVHLYEVRDALSKNFGSKTKAIKKLGITNSEWDEIGKLANTLPLKQGRHRGEFVGKLRDAESAELEVARRSTVHLICEYLKFLEM